MCQDCLRTIFGWSGSTEFLTIVCPPPCLPLHTHTHTHTQSSPVTQPKANCGSGATYLRCSTCSQKTRPRLAGCCTGMDVTASKKNNHNIVPPFSKYDVRTTCSSIKCGFDMCFVSFAPSNGAGVESTTATATATATATCTHLLPRVGRPMSMPGRKCQAWQAVYLKCK